MPQEIGLSEFRSDCIVVRGKRSAGAFVCMSRQAGDAGTAAEEALIRSKP